MSILTGYTKVCKKTSGGVLTIGLIGALLTVALELLEKILVKGKKR